MAEWNATLYSKFISERTRPAVDLVNRIKFEGRGKIIDIGCGPGNSTKVLAEKFSNSSIVGVDNSQDMIEKAKGLYPELTFQIFDAEHDFEKINEHYNVVFTNACIQWIPDHPTLLKQMMDILYEGGILAVQIPINYNEPIHRIIRDVANSDKWKSKISSPRKLYNLEAGEYFDLLSRLSSDFTMWETTYFHRMPSHESIIEWYKGTGLRPYLAQLNDCDAGAFEREVLDLVVKEYPIQENGEIVFRFPRLFFIATK